LTNEWRNGFPAGPRQHQNPRNDYQNVKHPETPPVRFAPSRLAALLAEKTTLALEQLSMHYRASSSAAENALVRELAASLRRAKAATACERSLISEA
jgi:hypothetical protein